MDGNFCKNILLQKTPCLYINLMKASIAQEAGIIRAIVQYYSLKSAMLNTIHYIQGDHVNLIVTKVCVFSHWEI